jgi:hypothetical protein
MGTTAVTPGYIPVTPADRLATSYIKASAIEYVGPSSRAGQTTICTYGHTFMVAEDVDTILQMVEAAS